MPRPTTTTKPGRYEVIDRWIVVNEEDRAVCRAQQEGRASRAADGGVFSPYWDELVHDFQKLCVTMMDQASRPKAGSLPILAAPSEP